MRSYSAALLFQITTLFGSQLLGNDATSVAPTPTQQLSVALISGELMLPDNASVFFTLQENTTLLKVDARSDNDRQSLLIFAPTLSERTEGKETVIWHTLAAEHPCKSAATPLGEVRSFMSEGTIYKIRISSITRKPFIPGRRVEDLLLSAQIGVSFSARGELHQCENGRGWKVCAIPLTSVSD